MLRCMMGSCLQSTNHALSPRNSLEATGDEADLMLCPLVVYRLLTLKFSQILSKLLCSCRIDFAIAVAELNSIMRLKNF